MPIITDPRPQAGSFSSCHSHEKLRAGRTVSRAVADVEKALQRTEGDFTIGLTLEGEMRLFDKIEEVAVPVVHFGDAPAAMAWAKPGTLAISRPRQPHQMKSSASQAGGYACMVRQI